MSQVDPKAVGAFDETDDLQRRLPYMPVFIGDFLASTATWAGEEQALYLLLLIMQWTGGPLPPSVENLARIVRYPPKRFITHWKARVEAKFDVTETGLVNRRLEEHRAISQAIAVTNHKRAKKAAQARHGKLPQGATAGAPSTPPWKANGSSKHSSEEG